MQLRKISIVLLALLLAAMAMVPMVSAVRVQNTNTATIEELNVVSLNQSNTQLPQLQYDKTQKKVVIDGEFKVDRGTQSSQITARIAESAAPTVSNIPFGAIVHQSDNGVTTIFDSTGQQLFATEDASSPLINTPDGALRATEIFEVPDKSLIVDDKSVTNVFYDNQRILTIIGDSVEGKKLGSVQRTSLTPSTPSPMGPWIEYGETAPIGTVGQFSARWNVPKSPILNITYPTQGMSGSVFTIWNGLERTNGASDFLLQPVLEWYVRDNSTSPYPTIANWSIATWWISSKETRGPTLHSTRRYGIPSTGELVVPGDLMQGNIYHFGAIWDGAISDLTLGISSTLFLNSSQSSDLTYHNLRAYTVLEGWEPVRMNFQTYNSSYVPGNTTFSNIIINDIDSNSVIPSSISRYINTWNWSTSAYGLSVTNTSWPTSITLNTGNI